MNLVSVMEEMGTALQTIDGLRVFPYWIERVMPPCAIVGWPEPITFDMTMRRGGDSMTFKVFVIVGKVDARTSRTLLGKYLNGSDASSVKVALDGGTYTACDTVRVSQASVESLNIASIDYLAAVLDVEVTGNGGA